MPTQHKAFEIDQPKPDGDWIGWKGWLELAGSQHRSDEVARFALAASKAVGKSAASVRREPDNAFDKHAVAVDGVLGSERWKLGYLPKDEARELSAFPATMPIVGRVIRVKFFGDRVYVTAQIFIPSKKARQSNGWEA